MLKDSYIFPAIAETTESGNYSVYFPDLPGCITGGDTMEEMLKNIKGALCLHLYGMEQDGDEIPEPSRMQDIKCEKGDFCVLAEADMKMYRKRRQEKYVNRVITLPDWLNEETKRSGINVSQLVQQTLKEHLGIPSK